jgi:C-terminal processing protease CtpA/Prc
MLRLIALFTLATLALSAQTDVLNFEAPHTRNLPVGWSASHPAATSLDSEIVHGSKRSLRIERTTDTPGQFSVVTRAIPVEFEGQAIELRGFIRRENVTGYAGMWLRQDGPAGAMLQLDNMQDRHLNGSADWAEYSIRMPLNPQTRQLFLGFLLAGTGKAWVDDMQLLVDGKSFWDLPKIERPKTALDTDTEFDHGSKIAAPAALSPVQIANLATLAKVWGFVKYHHQAITSGKRHWDYDLLRAVPSVLTASDRASANASIAKWVAALGSPGDCKTCATLDNTELHLHPDLGWIADRQLLGAELSGMLTEIHRKRPSARKQFYVSLAQGVGNPSFDNELTYDAVKLPDAGFELLALFRLWNIIEYWYPYRDVMHEDWDKVLTEFIPRIGQAADREEYQRQMMALIARVHDTHANLWSSLQSRPPVGACQLPVNVRFIEDKAVVAGYLDPAVGPATGMKPGDIIESMDGAPTPDLVKKWKPFYAASNDAAILRDVGRQFTRGACADSKIVVRRGQETLEFTAKRLPGMPASGPGIGTHDLAGETFRKLSPDVAYLKLSSVKIADAAKYIDSAAGTKGLIIDIRNYPSEFVVFGLGGLLVDKESQFARFTTGDLANPGAFHFGPPLPLTPAAPHYPGKVVILVDEVSQSQAEYTTMAFRSAPNATVIGSTTAGADGNVSPIPLPGGLRSMISGIGVFYPDKRPTQRVGILPDLEVKPTIEGIRAGRDEVLEAALRLIDRSVKPPLPQPHLYR